jgi:hypothetical protein
MIVIREKNFLIYTQGIFVRQVTRVHRYMAYLCAVCIQGEEENNNTGILAKVIFTVIPFVFHQLFFYLLHH